MIPRFLFISAIICLFHTLAQSEPAPWGIIVRESECSAFWAGDECVSFKVPDGWKALYAHQFKDGVISLGKKKCSNLKKKKTNVRWEQSCCEQLGLKYITLDIEAHPINSDLEQCEH